MSGYVNINGTIVPNDEPLFPANSRTIMYGDGCFETLRSYNGKFLHFEDHFKRLRSGLSYLEMTSDLTEERLSVEIQKLLKANECENEDVVVRIQCVREGESGYLNISDQSKFIISLRSVKENKRPLELQLVDTKAIPSAALNRTVKLSNSINYIKSAQEAKRKGGDDALMLTVNERVSETTIANVFWVKGNHVFTPSVECDLLPGVTRLILMELIKNDTELSLLEGEFDLNDIYEAEAMFCTNSVMEIQPVASLEEYSFQVNNEVVEKLSTQFEAYKKKYLK
ncbi:MAG: aminotransferase class IV [Balneola sp.]